MAEKIRGGARPGAGAKSKWQHGETRTIRVPCALASQVLEYAKDLDLGTGEQPALKLGSLSDDQLLAQINALAAEYNRRLPKSTAQQADELVDEIMKLMKDANFTPDMQAQIAARVAEHFLI